MTRLIDADELKRYIDNCGFCDRCPDASPRCQIDCEMPDFLTKRWEGVIDAQPTVEAEPVRQGKWIYGENSDGFDGYRCSYCMTHFAVDDVSDYHYCPYCGAKMDGGKHETD